MVKACISNKCHFIDITGEPAYAFMILDKYDKIAREKDVLIVTNCGFDCIPADLGALFNITRAKDSKQVKTVSNFIASMKGSASSGTLKSLFLILNNVSGAKDLANAVFNAWTGYSFKTPMLTSLSSALWHIVGFGRRPVLRPHYNSDVRAYAAPLPVLDPVCARRSADLLPGVYPEDFRVGHYLELPNIFGFFVSVLAFLLMPFVVLLSIIPGVKQCILFLLDLLPRATESERANNFFRCRQVGRDASDTIVSVTEIYGPDAYTATAEMSAQCALQIIESRDKMAVKNGVSTPAASFGLELVNRLNSKTGVSFKHLK